MKIPAWYPDTKSVFAPGAPPDSYWFPCRTLTFVMWLLPSSLALHPAPQRASFLSLDCPKHPLGLPFKGSAAISWSPSPGPRSPHSHRLHFPSWLCPVLVEKVMEKQLPWGQLMQVKGRDGDRALSRGSASSLAALFTWQVPLEWSWWREKTPCYKYASHCTIQAH